MNDYLDGRINKHEHTRPDKEDDRTRHTDALGAHAGPVLLAYRDRTQLNALVAGEDRAEPDVAFVAADGVGHAMWVVDDPRDVESVESAPRIPNTYIADGHHRAAAVRARRPAAAGARGRFPPSISRRKSCGSSGTTAWCATSTASIPRLSSTGCAGRGST